MHLKPDFKKAYILANDMLVAAHCIKSFPFDVAEFIKEQTDLIFCSYKRAWEKYGLIGNDLGSDSAVLTKLHGMNILFYNQDEYDARDPFNRLHETGHFLLGHETNLSADDPLYGIQEVETNSFTAEMLMPLPVLNEIKRRGYRIDTSYLQKNFGVSYSAAEHRIKTVNSTIYLSAEEKLFDDIIVAKFKNFIDRVAPLKDEYPSCWDDPMQAERDLW